MRAIVSQNTGHSTMSKHLVRASTNEAKPQGSAPQVTGGLPAHMTNIRKVYVCNVVSMCGSDIYSAIPETNLESGSTEAQMTDESCIYSTNGLVY